MAKDHIESLHTEAWRTASPDDKIRLYYAALDIPHSLSRDRLEAQLARRHSKQWEKVAEVIERRSSGDFRDNLYAHKNASLGLTLLVSAFARGLVHKRFLEALDSYAPQASAILDVGCENGFLTCFLALRWPKARIVGIDPCPEAIDCACQLAARLRITNVEFIVSDAANIPSKVAGSLFDLILSVTIWQEAGVFPRKRESSLASSNFSESIAVPSCPEYSAIAGMLAPDGQWIAAEMIELPQVFWWWCRALNSVGLGIDWQNSERMHVSQDDQLLTALVLKRSEEKPISVAKAQGFWISPEFNRWPGKIPWAMAGTFAEVFFSQLTSKRCVNRAVFRYDSGVECSRQEIWVSGPILFYYGASHNGQTDLQFRAITDLHEAQKHWQGTVDRIRQLEPASTRLEIDSFSIAV
jgi:SAM-dependent methyltransferase